jgi:hypothetical protein
MSKHCILGFKPQLRLEWRGPKSPERNVVVRSFRQLRRFLHLNNADRAFGTHSGPCHVKNAVNIDRKSFAPLPNGHGQKISDHAGSGIVDEDVNFAEAAGHVSN